jgi:hypothetical protein
LAIAPWTLAWTVIWTGGKVFRRHGNAIAAFGGALA